MIWSIIPAPVKRFAAWLLAGLGAVGIISAMAKRDARQKADLRRAKATIKAHEVRNEIDDDVAASPDPRERLREWQR